MLQPQTLLVTGGAGFIGSTFVEQCAARGQKVIVLDALTYAGHHENLAHIDASAYELVEGTICDGELVLKLLCEHAVDAIVNFAAESHVDNSIASPADFIETNIMGAYRMLEAGRTYWNEMAGEKKDAFRFLQISTDEVYGELGDEGKFHEDWPMRPNSPYSASKASGDHLARAWHETYGMPTILTNCTNNYGPRQHPEKLIPRMITQALSGDELPVYGEGKNVRDWIHVEDHCQGVYLALTKGKKGEAYCFGGNAEKQNIEVVHTICDTLDALRPREDGKSYREQIAFVTDRAGHDWRYAMNDSKAKRELQYDRKYTFETGLKETIEWYMAHHDWCQSILEKAA
jgi:dTDP-glucose 4,6-dehydratase